MKGVAIAVLEQLGYRLTRIPDPSRSGSALKPYEVAISTLVSTRSPINIVQIGANDGVINDPLYEIVRTFADRTQIILVEPQPALLPFLTENYAYHPAHWIVNRAVGDEESLTLYCIKQEIWGELNAHYAKGWPEYRAPTGVTSADKGHVERWLSRNYRGGRPVEELIDKVSVPCSHLRDILKECDMARVDVLQVDAEGLDDQVIYNCGVGEFKPSLINFESHSLSPSASAALEDHLVENGYLLSRGREDTLAIYCGRANT